LNVVQTYNNTCRNNRRTDREYSLVSWKQELNAKLEIAGIRKPFYKIIL